MSPPAEKTRILVDGSSFIFRAWHAMPDLTAPDGQPTGAVRGVANMLDALLREQNGDTDVVVVFDPPGKTFRHEMYSAYKANRPPMPEELRSQIPLIHEWVKVRGLPLFVEKGFEADDVIASLSRQLDDGRVVILSQDKDLAQCVNDRVQLRRGLGKRLMGEAEVQEEFGIGPTQIPDWLALAGDASDGIPGARGIGPKKAVNLLRQYGSLAGVMDAAADIPGKDGENIRQALEQLPLYLDLVTLRYDLSLNLAAISPNPVDSDGLADLYTRLGFSGRPAATKAARADAAAVVLSQAADLQRWLAAARGAEVLAVRFAADDPDQPHSPTVGVGLSAGDKGRAYVPLASGEGVLGAAQPSGREELLQKLEQGLAACSGRIVIVESRESLLRAKHLGIHLPEAHDDPLLMSYLLNPTAGRHQLYPVSQRSGVELTPYEEQMGKGASRQSLSALPVEQGGGLIADEARAAERLSGKLLPELEREPKRHKLYRQLDLPLASVLADMEATGVLIDCDMLRRHSAEMTEQVGKLQQRAWEIADREFNLDSPGQIGQVLFEELELPVIGKTRGGQPSTAENVLQQLADNGEELPDVLLRYRGLRKLISTYADKLPQQINPETGRIHTTYHQASTSTGRLSSTDPNLQNIPIRTAEGRRIRHAFCAPEGSVLVAADYSQIELRVMAHLSGDENLLQAFVSGRDVHAATAQELFGSSDDEGRRRAKAINFGLMYGMSAFGLSRQLKVAQSEAKSYMESYFARFPRVQQFMDEIRGQASEQGYVETLWGRRLYLPELRATNPARRKAGERAAINAPMQGTAADIIKQAMLSVHAWLCSDGGRAGRLLMQVHDELVLEVAESEAERVVEALSLKMSEAANLKIPLEVDVGVGANWEDAKKA